MGVVWNAHRFSGGLLALDTANTVVLRGQPGRTFDRFDDTSEIGRFADAASQFRADELGGRAIAASDPAAVRETVLNIRETTDSLFRMSTLGRPANGQIVAKFLRACAKGIESAREPLGVIGRPFGQSTEPLAFEAALAISAMSLLQPATSARLKICANCHWLFIDRSRNLSRTWCDMKVCGNRKKAMRHYRRHKQPSNGVSHDQV